MTKLAKFAKKYSRSRSGVVGLILFTLFAVTAVLAPIISPLDPIKPSASGVAAPLVPPEWTRIFDPAVSLNQNQFYSHFSSDAEGWNFGTNSALPANVTASGQQDPTQGFIDPYNPGPADPGSYRVSFANRNSTFAVNTTVLYVEKTFTFKYEGAGGVTYGLSYKVASVPDQINYDPTVDVAIVAPDGSQTSLLYNTLFYDSGNKWVDEPIRYGVGTGFTGMFRGPGDYRFRITMTFPQEPSNTAVNFTVWFDRIKLFTYGQVYGLMGSDNQGRDVWSFLVWGTRISFLVGILATVVAIGIGILVGLVSGYIGGPTDELIMRGTDFFLVLPAIPLLVVFAAILGPNIWNIIIIISILSWAGPARVIRSQTLVVKERTFVEAARALGSSNSHILFSHILPNVLALVFALAAPSVGGAIVFEAALSFLGLGDPTVTSWGQILNNAEFNGIGPRFWWMVVPPGLAIAMLSVSFIFIGSALDEIVNPKLRAR